MKTTISSIRCHRQILKSRNMMMPLIRVHNQRDVPLDRQYVIQVLGAVVHLGTLATDFPKPGEEAQKETNRQLLRITAQVACVAQEHQSIWEEYHFPAYVFPPGIVTN